MSDPGRQLPPRYEFKRRIGWGGMGEILLAHDGELHRDVAIKMLSDRFAEDADIQKRFFREAQAAARLSWHQNVVTTFDVGSWNDRPYIVMEYLPGGTLADRISAGDVDDATALTWLRQVASALDAAHEEGMIHRDVKPGNLLLDAHDVVHVGDFGIARLAEAAGDLTATGTVLGTAGYLSPEQVQGQQTTPASDQYSLAVVAFELLTGRRPFARENSASEASAHAHEAPPSLVDTGTRWQLEAATLARLDAVLARALSKEPARRFASCSEFVEKLAGAFADAPTEHLGAASAQQPTAVLASGDRRSVFESRRPLLPLAMLGLIAVMAAVAFASALRSPEETGREKAVQATTATQPTTTTAEKPKGLSREQARELNDQAFGLMNQGRYEEALPLLQRAVPALRGYAPFEAYALYNLGKTLLELGRCQEALAPLNRSEQLQGEREEIDKAQEEARECLEGDDEEDKPDRGKGKGKKDD